MRPCPRLRQDLTKIDMPARTTLIIIIIPEDLEYYQKLCRPQAVD